MYDQAGYFLKIQSRTRRLVPRYFVVSEDQVWYVTDQAEIRQAIECSFDISEVLGNISQAKSLPLADIVVGPKQGSWFRMLSKHTRRDYIVFPWRPQMLDELYQYFAKRDQPMPSLKQPAGTEQITKDIYTITLPNGHIYCGELDINGLPHSDSGREFKQDGTVYFGSFREGAWHGAGVLISPRLDMEYAEFCDGSLAGL